MAWFEPRGSSVQNSLGIDEAILRVNSPSQTESSWLYALSKACHTCPYSLLGNVSTEGEEIVLSTKHPWKFRLSNYYAGEYFQEKNTTGLICDGGSEYSRLCQFGVYELTSKNGTEKVTCEVDDLEEPVNIYVPLVLVIACLLGVGLVIQVLAYLVRLLTRLFRRNSSLDLEPKPSAPLENHAEPRKRVASLDTFRGISILLMIFVNDGAGGYEILEHAVWNGLQLADVVFPWFLWIMGVCIPISIRSQLKKKIPILKILFGIFKRSCILFGLGVMLNTVGVGPDLVTLRIFGVLQRFGVLYLVSASLCVILWPRNADHQRGCNGALRDVCLVFPQWIVHVALHVAHILITFLLPVPGCPMGYLGPGGMSEDGEHFICTGGVTGYLDRVTLGVQHLYQNPTIRAVYGSGPFDPEGPYGCLSSLLTVMLGIQAGATLLSFPGWKPRARRWAAWGITCLVLAMPLVVTGAIPVNKNLWSTSFTLVTGGLAFLLLAFCYLFVDVLGWWSGAPFVWPGMNATVMYVGHMVAYQLFPWHWLLGPMNTHLWLLIENLWGVAAWTLIAFLLYRKKFFLSI